MQAPQHGTSKFISLKILSGTCPGEVNEISIPLSAQYSVASLRIRINPAAVSSLFSHSSVVAFPVGITPEQVT